MHSLSRSVAIVLLLAFSVTWPSPVQGSTVPGTPLVPADWPEMLENWEWLIGQGEHPLVTITAEGDTITAVYEVELIPYGDCYIMLIDPESAGFPGFILLEDPDGAGVRMDFWATGEYPWHLWEFVSIEAADVDADGSTDILITAEYCTGMGPDGAIPFRATSIVSGSDLITSFMEAESD